MSEGPHESVQRKVEQIFRELAGTRAENLEATRHPDKIAALIETSLVAAEEKNADEIAFHLTDWNADAAFLVALHLFPERFEADEIAAGVGMLLVHVPAHVIAAARLSGCSTEDIFLEGDRA